MSPRQNKTPPIIQKVCTKMVEKCSVNTSPIMAFVLYIFFTRYTQQIGFWSVGHGLFYIQFFLGYCFIILRQFSTFIMLILRIMIIFKFEVTFIFFETRTYSSKNQSTRYLVPPKVI